MGLGQCSVEGLAMISALEPRCRACYASMKLVLADLGSTPVSNNFLDPEALSRGELFFPLKAYVCQICRLVQLPSQHTADDLFRQDYVYFSSYSKTWLDHAKDYTTMIMNRLGLKVSSRVVEVASNDGYLLQYFRKAGFDVLGIEPCASVARVAREKHQIPTIERFFGRSSAIEIAMTHGKADLIVANNVLAHVPDINDFVAGFEVLLQDEGVATFEFPHLLNLLELVQFDTIYHEHFCYLSLLACEPIFVRAGLRIFDIEELTTHGGSLRLYACKWNASHVTRESVQAMSKREKLHKLDKDEPYKEFTSRVRELKWSLMSLLIDLKRRGHRIAAYGAAAKGNTLLNFCGIGPDMIDYVVDQSPFKQGKYLPGTHLPVLTPGHIFQDRPDFLMILPWNLQTEIIDLMSKIRNWGGKFIIPIPSATILD